jgi:hypothetical protein
MQNDLRVPVYGILYDGHIFEFFLFNSTTDPYSFKYGLCPDHPRTVRLAFRLPDPGSIITTHPFINALRPICEIIFDLLLDGYVSSLKAFHAHSVKRCIGEHLGKWEKAISAAVRASEGFRDAEIKRQAQLTDVANSLAEEAMVSLKHRYEISTFSGNIWYI